MRVSIGLSFYNNEQTLADAVRSVFAQTFQDWELILVDDGSSDGSLKIAQAVDDPRVRVVSDTVNKGLSFRLNQIATLARGAYIARIDADDLMHPERLARQVEYLDAQRAVDLIGTGTYTIDSANRPVGLRGVHRAIACKPRRVQSVILRSEATKNLVACRQVRDSSLPAVAQNDKVTRNQATCDCPRRVHVLDVRPQAVLSHGLMIHPTVTGRADWFRRNPYNEAYMRAQDVELWCRTCQNSVFAALPEPLHFYREAVVREKAAAYLGNYLLTCRSIRNILVTYGPSTLGWPRTLLLIIKSHLKGAIFRTFTMLGAQSVLIAKRNTPLSESERAAASEVLGVILQTQVPGLSS